MKPRIAVALVLAIPFFTACNSPPSSSSALPASVQLYGACSPTSTPVSHYSRYNALVFGDFQAPSSDTEGVLAAGGNVTLSDYSVGAGLPSGFCGPALIAGGNLDFTSGNVFNGSAVYGGTATLTSEATAADGFAQDPGALDFAGAKSSLTSYSAYLGGLAPDGTIRIQQDTNRFAITLTGSDPFVNIFQVDSGALSSADSLFVKVPTGSTAVINVTGTCLTLQDFAFFLTGTDARHLLLNLPDVTRLTIQDIEIDGTVLAPVADVNFPSGDLYGSLFANSMSGAGELDLAPFAGALPIH